MKEEEHFDRHNRNLVRDPQRLKGDNQLNIRDAEGTKTRPAASDTSIHETGNGLPEKHAHIQSVLELPRIILIANTGKQTQKKDDCSMIGSYIDINIQKNHHSSTIST